MVTYYVMLKGNTFYVRDEPESEDWIDSFYSEELADKYCKQLNTKLKQFKP